MKKTKIFTLVIALLTVNALLAQKKQKDKVLNNKIYVVEFTETTAKKPKPVEDEISFKVEKLSSKFINLEKKLPPGPYLVEVDSSASPKAIHFTSESKSQDGEVVKWEGTIVEEAIEGTAVITNKKGKTTAEYSFIGNIKPKPGKKQ